MNGSRHGNDRGFSTSGSILIIFTGLFIAVGGLYTATANTGFAAAEPAGATVADVELMADYLPVKASGGIGDYETAMAMIEAGADRIGASGGVDILAGAPR